MKLKPGHVIGQYELLSRIGAGGMAEVWRAVTLGPSGFKRQVVVKRILPEFAGQPEFVDMFMREARIGAVLSHPNIVQTIDLVELEEQYLIVMESIEGITLHERLRRAGGKVPPAGFGAYVGLCLARALAYVHGKSDDSGAPLGLIHRDVTPSNVMLCADGNVKLLDFGIAKAVKAIDDPDSKTGVLKGKYAYMSPEHASGRVEQRSDLFSLGVVLHEALTSRRLFKGATDLQTLERIRDPKTVVESPSVKNPGAPPRLDAIVLKMLAYQLDERYASADALVADLSPVVHDLCWGAEQVRDFLAGELPPTRVDKPIEPVSAPTAAAKSSAIDLAHADTAEARVAGESAVAAADTAAETVERGAPTRIDPPRPGGVAPLYYLVGAGLIASLIGGIWLYSSSSSSASDPAPMKASSASSSHTPSESKPPSPYAPSTSSSSAPVIVPPPLAPSVAVIDRHITITSSPSGASIQVEGEAAPRGVTPLDLALPRAPVRLTLARRGCTPTPATAAVSLARLHVDLVGCRRAAPVRASDDPSRAEAVQRGLIDPFGR